MCNTPNLQDKSFVCLTRASLTKTPVEPPLHSNDSNDNHTDCRPEPFKSNPPRHKLNLSCQNFLQPTRHLLSLLARSIHPLHLSFTHNDSHTRTASFFKFWFDKNLLVSSFSSYFACWLLRLSLSTTEALPIFREIRRVFHLSALVCLIGWFSAFVFLSKSNHVLAIYYRFIRLWVERTLDCFRFLISDLFISVLWTKLLGFLRIDRVICCVRFGFTVG